MFVTAIAKTSKTRLGDLKVGETFTYCGGYGIICKIKRKIIPIDLFTGRPFEVAYPGGLFEAEDLYLPITLDTEVTPITIKFS